MYLEKLPYNTGKGAFVTLSSTGAKSGLALDENSFQQMLAAAYVVQQHNESLRSKDPAGTSQILNVIAEIQSLIRARGLNVADSAVLIAERLLALTGASGVSISLVTSGYLDCVAEAGSPAKIPGSTVSSHSLVATERLKAGTMFESKDSKTDLRLDVDLCRSVGVGSLVAAPVLRFGEIAGLIEARWQNAGGFSERELRNCRLMAGLMTGALERSVRIGNARTAENVTAPVEMAEVPPQTETTREVQIESAPEVTVVATPTEAPVPEPISDPETSPDEISVQIESNPDTSTSQLASSCRMCGRPFAGNEMFCGFCSMPRPVVNASEQLQSKWASLWFMQRAQGALEEVEDQPSETEELAAPAPHEMIELPEPEVDVPPAEPRPVLWQRRGPETENVHASAPAIPAEEIAEPEISFPFDERPPISERAGALARRHWRDALLAGVAIALAYGLFSAWPKSNHQPTWFQSLMVRVGVMHAPGKVFAGRPDARVWLDVHTELYYCSGEDLYGKTPDGEFTTQYNAQSDGFQPASTATCP